jgi:hypothetical protein
MKNELLFRVKGVHCTVPAIFPFSVINRKKLVQASVADPGSSDFLPAGSGMNFFQIRDPDAGLNFNFQDFFLKP